MHQHETDDLTGLIQTPNSGRERQPVEVCFVYQDVDAAYMVFVLTVWHIIIYVFMFILMAHTNLLLILIESEGSGEWCSGSAQARG